MKSFIALLRAGFWEFTRDRTALFFTLVFPLMFILLFGLFFGQQDDIGAYSVSVVLEDENDQTAGIFGNTAFLNIEIFFMSKFFRVVIICSIKFRSPISSEDFIGSLTAFLEYMNSMISG